MQNKFLITGANGLLGRDLVCELVLRKFLFIASGRKSYFAGNGDCCYIPLDITDREKVGTVIKETEVSHVIHCAAWTNVDAAEDNANHKKVYAVNVYGTENISRACAEYNISMTYISTDYVFNGFGTKAWKPEDKALLPVNYYGFTKLKGEFAVKKYLHKYFIIRTSWVFGKHGHNFVDTMLELANTYDTIKVVCDQFGTPTYTRDLANLIADISMSDKYGTYHATNEGGYISWHEFAREIFMQSGSHVKLIPVKTSEYGMSKAKRPYNSRLDTIKIEASGFKLLPDWRDALRRYLSE